jgi:hypothetical protein
VLPELLSLLLTVTAVARAKMSQDCAQLAPSLAASARGPAAYALLKVFGVELAFEQLNDGILERILVCRVLGESAVPAVQRLDRAVCQFSSFGSL